MPLHAIRTAAITLLALAGACAADNLRELSVKTDKTTNAAPAWIRHGALVYRVSTPDAPEVLPYMAEGFAMVHHLLDGSISQITMINGVIGHDHPGMCNWDGVWPWWGRVTYRAKDWPTLSAFMSKVRDESGVLVSFHVNLTDVNAGLQDYPETREFFAKLVASGSTYLRDRDPKTNSRTVDPPHRLTALPVTAKNPIEIVALVDYKKFWDSGLAKSMIDGFYAHLPYAPPILYLDVLNLSGGNFSTGYPDGPLGGSEATQREGAIAIVDYLKSKGTEVATEGDRPFLGDRATYGWLHCVPGISTDDYRRILGASSDLALQQVAGNTGGFNIAPIANTPAQLAKVREHYAKLLTGGSSRVMPGLDTRHIADRNDKDTQFSIAGCGDRFRGDWVDLVNNFYLTGIQELYHIGNGAVRTHVFSASGRIHISRFVLTDEHGVQTTIPINGCYIDGPAGRVRWNMPSDHMMLINPLSTEPTAHAGRYHVTLYGNNPGQGRCAVQVYANGRLMAENDDIVFRSRDDWSQEVDLGAIELREGANKLTFYPGPLRMEWSDGTVAEWPEPLTAHGLHVTNGDVLLADDYDRMWPDTWSGQKKIYFYSWDGTGRTWKLPADWAAATGAMLYPLTPSGRGTGIPLVVKDRALTATLLPQVPYILVPRP